jgi:predicted aspartyl protease
MECRGKKATRMVVFAEDEDATILGVDALERLRLEIDPITRRLKKAEALLAL